MDPLQKDRIQKALETQQIPNGDISYDNSGDDEGNKNHVPRSTLIIFWMFIGYIALTFVGAVYFATTTNVKIFNLSQIISQTSNASKKSIDIPLCFPQTNQIALSSSLLENKYSGKVASFQNDITSQSATLHSSITLQRGPNLFTYFINNNEIGRLTFFDPRDTKIKHGTIEGLRVGDGVTITETLNLRNSPNESKTKIELEVF